MRTLNKVGNAIIAIALAIALTGCASLGTATTYQTTKKQTDTVPDNMLKEKLILELNTGIKKDNGKGISDADFKKYNEIMDYLYKYPDKSEQILFLELANKYNQSASELKAFVNANMEGAIARDKGEQIVSQSDVIRLSEAFLKNNINPNAGAFTVETRDISASITGTRAICTIPFSLSDSAHEAIIKFEFTDNYQTVKVFQLKIDGKNIDSVTD